MKERLSENDLRVIDRACELIENRRSSMFSCLLLDEAKSQLRFLKSNVICKYRFFYGQDELYGEGHNWDFTGLCIEERMLARLLLLSLFAYTKGML